MLHLYIGCMFSGKTSKMIDIINETPDSIVFDYDTTIHYQPYLNRLCTHNNITTTCIKLKELYLPLEKNIFINESQFFTSLKIFVLNALSNNKNIYIFGLDGDFKQQKFGEILDLIPYCDTITKLHAQCACGNQAIFSKRISKSLEQYGPHDQYVPVCRQCL